MGKTLKDDKWKSRKSKGSWKQPRVDKRSKVVR